ncbi:MAG: hypothetical protein N3G22_03640 [Candidatus Micrarchaeota archaeon]|nr:hypothetical protein [Candidatus Micrarchaeota archaeon]
MKKMRAFAFAAFFLLAAMPMALNPACPHAIRTINVAAVIGESEGEIFQLEVETRPGTGQIYASINPKIGIATQESEEAGADYAFSTAGIRRSDCDVFYRFHGDFGTNSIDGPSAGAAAAIATKAALTGKSIRQDIVITGSLSKDGMVGEVGGVIEKAVAAYGAGAKYILVPKVKVHEAMLLSSISKEGEFSAIEVANVSEAERIMFSSQSEAFSWQFVPESKPLPENLTQLALDKDTARFYLVAKRVVDRLEKKVAGVLGDWEEKNKKEHAFRKYFENEIQKYRQLVAKGYLYTAANSAFLLSIDAEYLKIADSKIDVDQGISKAKDCLSSLEAAPKTYENFHWAAASDLRSIWAEKKLNETVKEREDQEGYTTLRNLLFANSWCEISGELAENANEIGGKGANESALSGLAEEKLAQANKTISESKIIDYDALWHYEAGLEARKRGLFGAAIYDAVYARTMQEITDKGVKEEKIGELLSSQRSSLWGKIYYSQGAYLYADSKKGGAGLPDAYRLLKYSQELDRASLEIDSMLLSTEKKEKPGSSNAAPIQTDEASEFDWAKLLLVCLLAVGIAIWWKGSFGKKAKKRAG